MRSMSRLRSGLTAVAVAAFAASFVVLEAACSELFEDPFQCSFDRDCAKFPGARCDTKRRVCVPGPGSDGGGQPVGPGPGPEADAALPPECDVSPKPVAIFEGTPVTSDAGVSGEVTTSMTLDCSKDWLMRGQVFVRSGATLTIQPGTTVRADKATSAGLVVAKGARLVAVGAREAPIVFASAEAAPSAGDWRGIVILGDAPGGTGTFAGDPQLAFGGGAADDNSGALAFVRIEHASLGLGLAGVGRGTRIDSVQVRQTFDACFTFQSGNADAKHLVCQAPGDEMFDIVGGYTGRLQFLFGHRTVPGTTAGHNGLEVRGGAPTVYNVTLCGRDAPNRGVGLAVRGGARVDLADAIITGWNVGFNAAGAPGSPIELRGSRVQGNDVNPAPVESPDAGTDDDNGFDEIGFFYDGARGNADTSPGLASCFSPTNPEPWPAAALTTNARTPPTDGFFDPAAAYVGAFRDATDPWLRGAWVRFEGP